MSKNSNAGRPASRLKLDKHPLNVAVDGFSTSLKALIGEFPDHTRSSQAGAAIALYLQEIVGLKPKVVHIRGRFCKPRKGAQLEVGLSTPSSNSIHRALSFRTPSPRQRQSAALPFPRSAITTCWSHQMSRAPRRSAQVLSTRRMNILALRPAYTKHDDLIRKCRFGIVLLACNPSSSR